MQWASVSMQWVLDFDISFTQLNKVSLSIAFFILEGYLGVAFSFCLDSKSLDLLD